LKTLITAAAAALLAFAAPAFAQTRDPSGAMHRHHERHRLHGGYRIAAHRSDRSRYGSGDVYVNEGRAAAPVIPTPGFAWRPQAEQEGVGADLIGPGSGADNPTGQHDVSR
jgi:hypothetical protein